MLLREVILLVEKANLSVSHCLPLCDTCWLFEIFSVSLAYVFPVTFMSKLSEFPEKKKKKKQILCLQMWLA